MVTALEKLYFGQVVAVNETAFAVLFQIARKQVVAGRFFRFLREKYANRVIVLVVGRLVVILLIQNVQRDRLLFVQIISFLRAVQLVPAFLSGVYLCVAAFCVVYRGEIVFVNLRSCARTRELNERADFILI